MYKCQQLKISITFIDLQVNLDTIPVINFVVTSIGYSTIETKEADRIGYNWFLFQHEYSGEGRGANSFVSIIMYLTCTIIVYLNRIQT
jgi:hypothetical protein